VCQGAPGIEPEATIRRPQLANVPKDYPSESSYMLDPKQGEVDADACDPKANLLDTPTQFIMINININTKRGTTGTTF
jgi:hypothetical protein